MLEEKYGWILWLSRKTNLCHHIKFYFHCKQNRQKNQILDVKLRQNMSFTVIWKEKVTTSAKIVSS